MKAARTALIFGFILVLGAILAWRLAFPAYTHRMNLFIEIEEGEEVHSGSGVIEVTWQFQPELIGYSVCTLNGDAIPVGLKTNPVIAVLHQYYGEYQTPPRPGPTRIGLCNIALLAYGLGVQQTPGTLRALARKSGRVAVPARGIPSFVVFSDPEIPSTARLVFDEDFPGVLGPGVRLRGLSLELTNEPITRRVVDKIPAVAAVLARNRGLEFPKTRNYAPFPSDFSQGEKK